MSTISRYTGRTDYYGSIQSTRRQKFGKKHADKVKRLEDEAKDPNMVVRGQISILFIVSIFVHVLLVPVVVYI